MRHPIGLFARLRTAVWAGAGVVAMLTGSINAPAADDTNAAGPALTGAVRDQNLKPLPGATVIVYTAAPKKGVGTLCPYCYADCQKRATTDATGHFKIADLDSNLVFRVLFVAKGHEPKFVGKVDPAVKPIEVSLQPCRPGIAPSQQLKGRVIGAQNKPIAGAVVSIRGIARGESTRYGGNDDIDPEAVTDDDGQFVLNSTNNFDGAILDIEAHGYADKVTAELPTGGAVNEIKMTEGASVKGRLVKNGRPVAGIKVGVSGAVRNAEVYVGHFETGTDQDGRFTFLNLPPNRDYLLYANMALLRSQGAVLAQMTHLAGSGSVKDVGDVPVTPAFVLAGQVRLSDGKPFPAGTKVTLERAEAWDSADAKVDKDGRFRFAGVPSEPIHLSVRLKGYHLSARNKSLNTLNPFWLDGMVKADKTNLVVQLDLGGKNLESDGNGYVDMGHDSLQGAEAGQARQGDIHVTGKVVDAETGQPIDAFTVIEGRIQPWGMTKTVHWAKLRQTGGVNGQLDLYLDKGQQTPAIAVAAKGYLPQASAPISSQETNLTFALKKGDGPNGVVLQRNGQPAAGVTVYLADMQNGVYVDNTNMSVRERIYQGTRTTKTDDKGRFSFDPAVDDYGILVLADDGFAEVTVQELSRRPEVKLQAWGRVEGQLMIGARPASNAPVRLGLAYIPYAFYPRDFAPLNLYLETHTDAAGHFSFGRVPPIDLEVYYSPTLKGLGQGPIAETQQHYFSLKPGETKTLALGGKGRPVIGKIVVTGYDGAMDWGADLQSLEVALPPLPVEEDTQEQRQALIEKINAAGTDDEKERLSADLDALQKQDNLKLRDFYTSEKGREYYFQNRRYNFNCAPDGTFRIDDVLPGEYNLRVDFRDSSGGQQPIGMRLMLPQIASLNKEIKIPGGPGDKPYDLGLLEAASRNPLAVGKLAPDFKVKTVDGKTVKLSDYAGKYVLLDFWATWCGPCRGETPNLKATYDAYKDDPRFRMLGLSLDDATNAPGAYASKNHLGWTMGFLGNWSKANLPNQYGVYGIPSIFLIGPDGKIVAKDLRGEDIKATVDKALAQQN